MCLSLTLQSMRKHQQLRSTSFRSLGPLSPETLPLPAALHNHSSLVPDPEAGAPIGSPCDDVIPIVAPPARAPHLPHPGEATCAHHTPCPTPTQSREHQSAAATSFWLAFPAPCAHRSRAFCNPVAAAGLHVNHAFLFPVFFMFLGGKFLHLANN